MKAKFIYENINFNRGGTSLEKLGIGKYFIPSVKELLKNKSWAKKGQSWNPDIQKYEKWRKDAMNSYRSNGYRKYTEWAIIPGHLTRSSSSVFSDWLEEKKDKLSLKEVKDALNDLWPNSDLDSKERLINYAKKLGIK